MGIVVVIAHKKRSRSPIPLVLKSEWKTREPMNPTHQEQEVLYGVAQPDEEVYAVDPAPGVYNDEVVHIWGSETCPPLAFDGVKAHGSVCITAYNIPPPSTRGLWSRATITGGGTHGHKNGLLLR